MNRPSVRGAVLTFLLLAALLGTSAPVQAQTVVATIPGLSGPNGVGVNPTTNRIYVANAGSNTVSVIQDLSHVYLPVVGNGASSF